MFPLFHYIQGYDATVLSRDTKVGAVASRKSSAPFSLIAQEVRLISQGISSDSMKEVLLVYSFMLKEGLDTWKSLESLSKWNCLHQLLSDATLGGPT